MVIMIIQKNCCLIYSFFHYSMCMLQSCSMLIIIGGGAGIQSLLFKHGGHSRTAGAKIRLRAHGVLFTIFYTYFLKALSHGAIFLATCNPLLLLSDVNL